MGKMRKLDRLYEEFERDYSGKSEEEMAKIISDLEKEVAGKESALAGLEGDKKENLSKDIEQGKKRLENLKGYTKNKTQIEKIRVYRDSLVTKLGKEKSIKEKSCELEKKAEEDLIKVSKKLADEKYTMTLDQDEYNGLLEEKARLEKEMKEQSAIYMKSSKRVTELQSKISKCNMAWKTLFVNKDWDEIHRIALQPDTRFTRKIDGEKAQPLSDKKQPVMSKEDEELKKQLSANVTKILEEEHAKRAEAEKEEGKETTKALVEKKDNWFKRMWNKIVTWVNGDKKEDKKTENVTEEKPIEKIEEEKPVEEEKTTTQQERDAFLEGLRQHIDPEYRKTVREGKEAAYIEAHKVQPQVEDREEEK